MAIFDANCPEFFAPNERQAYAAFLDSSAEGYEVCELDGRIVGAFGLSFDEPGAATLNWIMLDPDAQGIGIGSAIMQRIIGLARRPGARTLNIAASQKSAPFFASFGAEIVARTDDGWGPGMHRVDMQLSL